MIRKLAIAIPTIFLLVLLVHLAVFYFRLGWFLILIWPAGFFLSLLIARSLRLQFPAIIGALVVLCVYVLSVSIVSMVFLNQKSHRTFQMSWIDKGSDNQHKQAEVVLRFADYPRHYVGIFSSELADHLRESRANPVPVTMEISSVFWCVQGHHEEQIGQLTHWNSVWSYSGVDGMETNPSPWAENWWCP
jgi:hypothetical protein